jgi:hypothetical protein
VCCGDTPLPDAFERTVSSGWGTADRGGSWVVSGGTSNFAVTDGTGLMRMSAAGSGPAVRLSDVTETSTDLRMSLALDKPQTGGGTYLSVVGRRVGSTGDYRLKLRYTSTGAVNAYLVRASGGETTLTGLTVPGLTYQPGEVLNVRLVVTGTSPTWLSAKVWRKGTAEPSGWLLTASDATAGLQSGGTIGLDAYLSGSSTNAPHTVAVDDVSAAPAPA